MSCLEKVVCSQTLDFLFKVRPSVLALVLALARRCFRKNEKEKLRECTGYEKVTLFKCKTTKA